MDWVEWASTNAPNCPTCRVTTKDGLPWTESRCDTCRVDLMADNRDAAHIYMACRHQVVTAGMGEVIDINHLPVWQMIDRMQVRDPLRCFELIIKTFHHYLRQSREKE